MDATRSSSSPQQQQQQRDCCQPWAPTPATFWQTCPKRLNCLCCLWQGKSVGAITPQALPQHSLLLQSMALAALSALCRPLRAWLGTAVPRFTVVKRKQKSPHKTMQKTWPNCSSCCPKRHDNLKPNGKPQTNCKAGLGFAVLRRTECLWRELCKLSTYPTGMC